MSRTIQRVATENGSITKYRCPACANYREAQEILWDRIPSSGDPGKVRCCLSCSGVASLVMRWSAPERVSSKGVC